MSIVLSHKTAFQVLRYLRCQNTSCNISFSQPEEHIFCKNYSQKLNYETLEYIKNIVKCDSVDVLVNNKNLNNRHNIVNIKVSKLFYPKKSFYRIDDKFYMPCPELIFYQLADILDEVNLALLGLELCGTYTFNLNHEFISDVLSITNPQKILNFLYQLKKANNKCNNILKAISIAEQLGANSSSPQESRLYIMLCFKRSFGGYGVKDMVFNKAVKLTKVAKEICFQKQVLPDLSNPKTKISIEYDSSEFHDNVPQSQKDKLRIDALVHDGWQVFVFVLAHTHNFLSMDHLAKDILKANGQDVRFQSEKFLHRRKMLFYNLYHKPY